MANVKGKYIRLMQKAVRINRILLQVVKDRFSQTNFQFIFMSVVKVNLVRQMCLKFLCVRINKICLFPFQVTILFLLVLSHVTRI